MKLSDVNHIAIICSDYSKSLKFYTEVLGLEIISEEYREQRKSHLTKLAFNGKYLIELFTFPSSPERPSYPEACGLRHLAFQVESIEEALEELDIKGIAHEPLRNNADGSKCFFMQDPDGLPIEIVEEAY